LHDYLNGVKQNRGIGFYDSFSPSDRTRIAQTLISTNNNPWFGAYGGNTVNDRIFLLSIEEVVEYFGDSGQLKNRPKDPKSAYFSGANINDQYNSARIATDEAGTAWWWWLRSPGYSGDAAYVFNDGTIRIIGGSEVGVGSGGVRPALWLNL
jgi:hypothetical protein